MLDNYIFLILLMIVYLLMITYVELKRRGRGLLPGLICGIAQGASLFYFNTINESILTLPAMEGYSRMEGTITTIAVLFLINVALIVMLNLLVEMAVKKKEKLTYDEDLTDAQEDEAQDGNMN